MKITVLLFVISLLLSGLFVNLSQAQQQGQDTYSLDLQGFAWNQTTLRALIVVPENESWWNPVFVNSTLRAISKWNEAIQLFSSNYLNYSYLSAVNIVPSVTNISHPGFDIYVMWKKSNLSNTTDEIGLAQTTLNRYRSIENCTITLTVENNHGYSLTERDVQNVALHELGHGLGLGHSNFTGNLMAPMYTLRGGDESVSTLDVYGVAKVFEWIAMPEVSTFSFRLNRSSVTLPADIDYVNLPSEIDNPPLTIFDNPVMQVLVLMVQILLHPQILFIAIVLTLLFVIIGLIPRKRADKQKIAD